MMRLPSLLMTLLIVPSLAWSAPLLFPSRVPYEPLVKKLALAGQSRDKILHPKRARDLLQLDSGARYKFTVDGAGTLAIAPLPAAAAGNEYVHPILAAGAPVATAGGITVEHGPDITRVTLDEDSQSYCPSFASLKEAVTVLTRLGVAPKSIALTERAPRCAPQ